MAEIHKSNFKFAWDLYKKLASKKPGENVFFSPVSINAALCMALAGARGNSAAEMSLTLHLSGIEPAKLHSAVGDSLMTLNKSTEGVNMSLANKMYFERTFEILPEFINVLQKEYLAELGQVDFIKNFEPARLEINKWVEEQTKEKIKDLLAQGALDSLTRLVLVNAIYFKGLWQKQFDPEASYDGQFFRVPEDPNPLDVKFMYIKDKFNFGRNEDLQCTVLELPFKGNTASMVLILPYDIDGLDKLEKQLDAVKLEKMMQHTRQVEVEVHIPRFKLESTFNLEEILPELGMKDVFLEDRADFSGVTKQSGLKLSQVTHKAVLEVTEEGAEAAAATAVVMVAFCLDPDLEFFSADKPFLVAIKQGDCFSFFGRFSGK